MYKTHMHHTPPSPPISMHARTHTQHKRPKRSNRNWKQIPCAPQNLPNFSLQVSFTGSSFTSTGQSIFSCCWLSEVRPCAAAINAPCPTGDYRHHRVSQQPSIAKRLLHQLRKTPPRASNIQQERKETEERISEVPPRGVSQASLCLQACACAPVNKTDHQCWTATHVDTVNSTRPHELRVISVVLDANLRTRSGHPPEVASQLMHPSSVCSTLSQSAGARSLKLSAKINVGGATSSNLKGEECFGEIVDSWVYLLVHDPHGTCIGT